MLYYGKHTDPHQPRASPLEACFSFCGLSIAIALCGGLAGLIYGIVKPNSTALIAGGVVFGVSIALTVLLVLICVFCIKKDQNPDKRLSSSRVHHLRSQHSHGHRQQRQSRPRPSRQGRPSRQPRENVSVSTPGDALTIDQFGFDLHSTTGLASTHASLHDSNHYQRSQFKTTNFVNLNQSLSSTQENHILYPQFDDKSQISLPTQRY
ncbi:unnamed protein product [Didymodactylos carnosus]|uniref:Uncharacterized protein n=1 Tax=Didymodactylos carnosus TaxID=1234261 RepID=A0A813WHW6_9BILA|nr:unnamed protein product [Didymodactylos carnosus]CAF0856163.1 unnamed protein product [Didymodactylos carnosus]CAF3545164.1 unnamed protein product [Didymodactylos carnosus]CAF3643928.1 unnamed protein product [Didymodactylos carnosus]